MPYLIRLQQAGASTILDEAADREAWLDHITFQVPSDNWRLGDLDPSGSTSFNRIQASRLLEEVQALKAYAETDGQKALLARMEEMLERCRDSSDLHVVFQGM